MRSIDRRYVWVSALLVLMLAGFARSSSAVRLSAGPDTVRIKTDIGTSATGYVMISDGRDTTAVNQTPLTNASLSITGGSQWSLVTNSTISFFGATYALVRYTPTSSTPMTATLVITGDSNTVYVILSGTTNDHKPLQITGSAFYNLRPGIDSCHTFTLTNPNSFAVSVNVISLTFQDSLYRIANVPSLPDSLASNATLQFQVCAHGALLDSNYFSANIHVEYSYATGSDYTGLTLTGKTLPFNTSCLGFNGSPAMGAVLEGASTTVPFAISDLTDSAVIIDSAVWTSNTYGAFSITSPTFPVTIQSLSTQNVNIKYSVPSPATQDNYMGQVQFYARGTSSDGYPCSPLTATVTGTVLIPVTDTTTLDVPSSGATLSISATTTKSRHLIFIHNAGTTRLELESLVITDSSSIAFFGQKYNTTQNMGDTLNAGETSHGVYLTLEAPNTGTYNINLELNYKNAFQSEKYVIVAHRLPTQSAGVATTELPAAFDFTMNPNPAHGEVTISLPAEGNSTVEIYDVLGNLLVRAPAFGQYVWDGSASGHAAVASGTYIVRVLDRRADGTLQSTSKRLLFVR